MIMLIDSFFLVTFSGNDKSYYFLSLDEVKGWFCQLCDANDYVPDKDVSDLFTGSLKFGRRVTYSRNAHDMTVMEVEIDKWPFKRGGDEE